METLQANIDATLRSATENLGAWQVITGGRVTADPGTTRDPGAEYERNVPGPKKLEPITVSRDYDETRDGAARERLVALCGSGTTVFVGRLIRDGGRNVVRVDTNFGIITEVGPPEGNTKGGTDMATLEVVIALNG